MSWWDDPQKWIRIAFPGAVALWIILPRPIGSRWFLVIGGVVFICGAVSKDTRTGPRYQPQPATRLERILLFLVGVAVIAIVGLQALG